MFIRFYAVVILIVLGEFTCRAQDSDCEQKWKESALRAARQKAKHESDIKRYIGALEIARQESVLFKAALEKAQTTSSLLLTAAEEKCKEEAELLKIDLGSTLLKADTKAKKEADLLYVAIEKAKQDTELLKSALESARQDAVAARVRIINIIR